MIGEITIKFSPDSVGFNDACNVAWDMHMAKCCKVKFNWNGTMIIIDPSEIFGEEL